MFAVGGHSPEYRLTADGFTVRKEMGKYERADKRALKAYVFKCFVVFSAVINVLETD